VSEEDALHKRAAALPGFAAALRRHDRERFQTALFAPARSRDALFALYAFNFEVAHIPEVTREPILGRIRLEWWREAIAEIYAGTAPRRHDIVEPLAQAIGEHRLSRRPFETLLDARERDLADEPPPSLEALEEYAEGSSASLVQLALEILGVRDDSAIEVGRSVGIAYALSGLLLAVPFHARMKRVYLPKDVTDSYGLDIARTLFELKASPAVTETAKEIAALAGYHLSTARARAATVPRHALPALLPAIIAARRLKLLAEVEHNLFDTRLAQPDPRLSWRLAWAAWRGRY
jgi:NADH dehydrogenase [ubiquinone] 1 alpha subcomplex assembly factor 6